MIYKFFPWHLRYMTSQFFPKEETLSALDKERGEKCKLQQVYRGLYGAMHHDPHHSRILYDLLNRSPGAKQDQKAQVDAFFCIGEGHARQELHTKSSLTTLCLFQQIPA